ncbi:uncharacterized protein LOC131025138 [Salvia miltiorrhiza]|uniref:uncharacterized protein LOC131025138 n=1 Tax=Salvia miltiorrhiza TaxID=226208 RepID=UPI0025AC503D|nr:uncharacterized protein LOC131025138 [Salvia miltiorrhiza]
MFDLWKEVFGKDRATGANAEDLMEALHHMYSADNLANRGIDGANHIPTEEETATEDGADNVCQGDKRRSADRVSNKKRKTRDEMTGVYAMLGEIGRNTGERLADLATRVGYEFDLGQARQHVFEQLGKIPGLDITQKFDICEILADKVQRLEIFIGLPDEAKIQYVAYLLQTKGTQG